MPLQHSGGLPVGYGIRPDVQSGYVLRWFPIGYRREDAFRLVVQFDWFSSWLYVGGVSVGYIKNRVTSSYKF